jgi:hypothetical protein
MSVCIMAVTGRQFPANGGACTGVGTGMGPALREFGTDACVAGDLPEIRAGMNR